ncbi:response regulator transcription factor [Roseibacterium beibuensis]|uniref:Response regulator transcription factor n=1 Tax=[Roseibacterium] beibuensis TaxID=1193142 RepID=A0ABP9L2Z4_9RHOB|nr:response regulator transcription factor [Roseibacterium beibuensis]MCS6621312.1 response regulator transcription factor [Roseibacterium beibuensis]
MRIVLIEDNQSLAKGITYRLQDLGHAIDVISDGLAADEFLRGGGGELVILDINLPRMDGLSILRAMRARGDGRPVLLLTARSETHDRVEGLDAGADDYLVKPFAMAELEARVRALSRRLDRNHRPALRLGPLSLDLDGREVAIAGEIHALPRREISVLESLLLAEGRIVPKNDLLDHVYGTGADVEESAIEVHISRLRKRLKPHGVTIRVRRGLGYAIGLVEDTATP